MTICVQPGAIFSSLRSIIMLIYADWMLIQQQKDQIVKKKKLQWGMPFYIHANIQCAMNFLEKWYFFHCFSNSHQWVKPNGVEWRISGHDHKQRRTIYQSINRQNNISHKFKTRLESRGLYPNRLKSLQKRHFDLNLKSRVNKILS